MVNIEIARNRKRHAIIVTVPRARSRSTSAASHNVAAVALQHGLSGIASATNGDPVVEQIAVVCGAVALGFDGQLRQI